jgi:hypothetical protein
MQFFKMTIHQKCSVLVWEAWLCISTSSLASTITHLRYNWTAVVSFREQSEKQIHPIISQATSRRAVQYYTRLFRTYISVFQEGYKLCYWQMQWHTQEFFSGGEVQQIQLRTERMGSGGGSPLVSGSAQFANEWNLYY